MNRCDRCGHPAVDAVGERQCGLFDAPAVDPRATDAARAELRAGRVLCSACQRTPEMFPVVGPVRVTAPPSHFPRPVVDHWTRTRAPADDDTESLPGMAEADAAELAATEVDLRDEEDTGTSIQACEETDTTEPVGTATFERDLLGHWTFEE